MVLNNVLQQSRSQLIFYFAYFPCRPQIIQQPTLQHTSHSAPFAMKVVTAMRLLRLNLSLTIGIVLVIASMFFGNQSAKAVVTTLLRDDGDVGDPLPSGVILGVYQFGIIPGDGNGDQINTIHWTATVTSDGCTKTIDLGNNTSGMVVNLGSLGSATIKADITYRSKSTNPPTPVPPNTVTATISVSPPPGFTMIPFDQTVEYNFGAPGNAIAVQFQLTMGGGQNLGGYNMVAVEKTNYIVPAGTPLTLMVAGVAILSC